MESTDATGELDSPVARTAAPMAAFRISSPSTFLLQADQLTPDKIAGMSSTLPTYLCRHSSFLLRFLPILLLLIPFLLHPSLHCLSMVPGRRSAPYYSIASCLGRLAHLNCTCSWHA